VGVLRRDDERVERRSGGRVRRPGHRKGRGGGGGDGDRAGGAVDRPGDGVGRGDRLVAGLGEGGGEGVRAVVAGDEGVVRGEGRAGAAACEVDDPGVAGGGVVVGVLGRDDKGVERGARRRVRRPGHRNGRRGGGR